jgi:hypothetical protein
MRPELNEDQRNQSIFSKSENTKKEKKMIEWMDARNFTKSFLSTHETQKPLILFCSVINHRITESIEHKRNQKTKLGKSGPKTKAHIFNYLSQKIKRD